MDRVIDAYLEGVDRSLLLENLEKTPEERVRARLTHDLDIVYSREPENLERLARLLAHHGAYLRGAPPGLPFTMDAETLRKGLNFTLTTDLGPLDLLGEMLGAGTYEDILPNAEQVELFGYACFVVDLETLIAAKRAAGRPKDLEVLAELQALTKVH